MPEKMGRKYHSLVPLYGVRRRCLFDSTEAPRRQQLAPAQIQGYHAAWGQDDTDVSYILCKYGLDVIQATGSDDCTPSVIASG
jgi:hypothetical protein